MCSKAKVKLGLEREHKARKSSRHVEERAAHGRRLEANIINIARMANAVPCHNFEVPQWIFDIVVPKCQKCNGCLNGHTSQGLLFEAIF